MAKHMSRNRKLVTSYACKQGEHKEQCQNALIADGCDELLVCHCRCHDDTNLECTRDQCATAQWPTERIAK